MKNLVLRSSLIGLGFMVLNIMVGFVALVMLWNSQNIMLLGPNAQTFGSLIYLLFYALVSVYQVAFCGYPFVFLLVAVITWFAIRNRIRNLAVREGKNRTMFAMWLSSAIAVSPFILAAIIDLFGTLIANGLHGSRGSKYELVAAYLLFVESVILIIVTGLAARFLVRNNSVLQSNLVEDVK